MVDRLVTSISGLDPRIKLAAALCLGLSVWRAGAAGLAGYGLLLGLLLLLFRHRLPGGAAMIRRYALFVFGWVAVKAAMDLAWGVEAAAAFRESTWLAARLFVLLLTGLTLGMTTSSRQLGMAAHWALRPVLRDNAWKVSLALAVMVQSLPLGWQALARVRQGLAGRRLPVGRLRRLLLLVQGVLRLLGRRAWEQAVAVASRRLDRPEAWTPDFPGGPLGLAGGLAVVLGLAGLAFV